MEELRALALDEQGVGAHLEYGLHGQDVGLHDVLQRRDEGLIAGELLVPPAVAGGEHGADVHLVDRRVELHPRKPPRERVGIAGEEVGEVAVLEVSHPVRHAEVTEIDDRRDVTALQLRHHLVGHVPVVAAVAEPDLVQRWPEAEHLDAEVLHQLEVGLPVLVEAALLQLVLAFSTLVDGGVGVLDSGGEHEVDQSCSFQTGSKSLIERFSRSAATR